MKKVLLSILLFAGFGAAAQTYTPVAGRWQYQWLKVDSGYRGPLDTLQSAPNGSTAVIGSTLYIKLSTGYWTAITGAGGSGVWGSIVGSLPAQTDLAAKFGTKYDTTVRKLDTLYAITDSTFGFYINGEFTSFKALGAISSFDGRGGAIILTQADVVTALGFLPSQLPNVANSLQVINSGNTTSWQTGIYSARPAPGNFGSYYTATDSLSIYFDNGISWVTISKSSVSVPSVFGRTGNVVADSGDYNKSQVGLANVLNALQIVNIKGTPSASSDSLANRPAAGVAGRIFVSIDSKEIYRDNGTSWDKIGSGATGGVTTFSSLTDVNLTSLINGQLAQYNSMSGKWVNVTPTNALVGLGNVPNVDATNAANISTGTLPAARIGAGSIDLTTKVTGALPDTNIASAANWNAKYGPSDTSGTISTRAYRQKLADSLAAIISTKQPAGSYYGPADTAGTISTRAYRQKGLDSLAALKKNLSDSSANSPSAYTTQASRQKLSDSLQSLIALRATQVALVDTAAALRGLISSGFDSASAQGGGFHTQPYNDTRYLKRTDSSANLPGNFTTQASRQKLSDSLQALINSHSSDSGFSVQIGANSSLVPIQKYTSGSARFILGDTSQGNPGAIVTQASRKKLADSLAAAAQNALVDTAAAIRNTTYGIHFRGKGQPGDTGYVYGTDSTIHVAAQRDSAGRALHHVINPDSSRTAYLDFFSSTLPGIVPASPGGTTTYLRADGTWATPPGGGSSEDTTNLSHRVDTTNTNVAVLQATVNHIQSTQVFIANDRTDPASDSLLHATDSTHLLAKGEVDTSTDGSVTITDMSTVHTRIKNFHVSGASGAYSDTSQLYLRNWLSAGFQAMINKAQANHKNIVVDTNYTLPSGGVSITSGWVPKISGRKGDTLFYTSKTGSALTYLYGLSNIEIEGVTFANTSDTSSIGNNCLNIESFTSAQALKGVYIHDNTFIDFFTSILGKGIRGGSIYNNHFKHYKGRLLTTTSPATDFRFVVDSVGDKVANLDIYNNDGDGCTGCTVGTALETGGGMDGLYYGPCSGCNIYGNRTSGYTEEHYVYQPGLGFIDTAFTWIHGNIVNGYLIPSSKTPTGATISGVLGIRAEGQNLAITDNSFYNCANQILSYAPSAWNFSFRNLLIDHNHIFITRYAGNVSAGISAVGYSASNRSKNVRITNNDFNIDSITLAQPLYLINLTNYDSSTVYGNTAVESKVTKTGGGVTAVYLNMDTTVAVNAAMMNVDTVMKVTSSTVDTGVYTASKSGYVPAPGTSTPSTYVLTKTGWAAPTAFSGYGTDTTKTPQRKLIGTLFSSSNFTTVSPLVANGVTVAASGGQLAFSSGSATGTQSLDLPLPMTCGNYIVSVTETAPTPGSGTFGVWPDSRSVNTYSPYGFMARFDMSTDGTEGKIIFYQTYSGGTITLATSSATLAFSAGDAVHMDLVRYGGVSFVAYVTDQTSGALPISLQYTFNLSEQSQVIPNIGNLGLASQSTSGSINVTSLSIEDQDTYSPVLAIVRDSKSFYQLPTNNPAYLYEYRLNRVFGPTQTYSGPADRADEALLDTSELLMVHPQSVIIGFSTNDLNSGESVATVMSHFRALDSFCVHHGFPCYFLAPIYQTSNTSTILVLYDSVYAEFPNQTISSSWNLVAANPTAYLGDGTTHPNEVMDSILFQNTLQSNLIQKGYSPQPLPDGGTYVFNNNTATPQTGAAINVANGATAGSFVTTTNNTGRSISSGLGAVFEAGGPIQAAANSQNLYGFYDHHTIVTNGYSGVTSHGIYETLDMLVNGAVSFGSTLGVTGATTTTSIINSGAITSNSFKSNGTINATSGQGVFVGSTATINATANSQTLATFFSGTTYVPGSYLAVKTYDFYGTNNSYFGGRSLLGGSTDDGSTPFQLTGNGYVSGGSLSIGTTTQAASALLNMSSTTQGLLTPRMSTTQQNAISSPATGLIIWNTDSAGLVVYNGSAWLKYLLSPSLASYRLISDSGGASSPISRGASYKALDSAISTVSGGSPGYVYGFNVQGDNAYTVLSTDEVVYFNTPLSANRVITLPNPSGLTKRHFRLIANSAIFSTFQWNITTTSGTALIYLNNQTGATSPAANISGAYDFYSDGTSWYGILTAP